MEPNQVSKEIAEMFYYQATASKDLSMFFLTMNISTKKQFAAFLEQVAQQLKQ